MECLVRDAVRAIEAEKASRSGGSSVWVGGDWIGGMGEEGQASAGSSG